jgi:hypothetical protein
MIPQYLSAITGAPALQGVVGFSYALTVTGGASGNPVQLTAAGGCGMSGNVVAFVAPGVCTITATQAGGGLYMAAAPVTHNVNVVAATPEAVGGVVRDQVTAFVQSGAIASSDAAPLSSQLQTAMSAYSRGNDNAGDNQMNAFINHVQAVQRSGRMSDASAQTLIGLAQRVIAAGH